MDQDAFRQLVAKPHQDETRRGQGYDRRFGQHTHRAGEKAQGTRPDDKTAACAPRQVASTQFHGSHSKNAYMDRSEMRRRGIDAPLELHAAVPIAAIGDTHSEDASEAHSDTELDAAWAERQAAPPMPPTSVPFRPINAAEPVPEPKRDTPEVVYVNGKRMRKKKAKAAGAPATETKAAGAPTAEVPATHQQGTAARAGIQPAPPPTTTVRPLTPAFVAPAGDDADIFGEAGEWAGLSDEDTKATPPPPTRRDWFAREPEPAPPEPMRVPSQSPPPDAPQRLEGLSTSALPSDVSRWLLDRADAPPRTDTRGPPRKRQRGKKGRAASDSP